MQGGFNLSKTALLGHISLLKKNSKMEMISLGRTNSFLLLNIHQVQRVVRNPIFGKHDWSHGRGDQSYRNSGRSHGNGDWSHGNGDWSHRNGDSSYGNSDRSYGNGDQSHGNGDHSHRNGDWSHKAGYTARHKSWGLGRGRNVVGRGIGGAVYMTALVTCNLAGAEMPKPLTKC